MGGVCGVVWGVEEEERWEKRRRVEGKKITSDGGDRGRKKKSSRETCRRVWRMGRRGPKRREAGGEVYTLVWAVLAR